MSVGMNCETGKSMVGVDHLRQSIMDILTTRIGTRVMRRDYGSRVLDLIDDPVNETFKVDIYAAVAEALDRWEPRFKLKQVNLTSVEEGKISISFEGIYVPSGKPITMEGLQIG
ncbi:phage baseplate assembly protein GpW [Bartonella schoenbuchensis m07a]|uniref:Phage baseplate assembly protein GpW n=2 Tax=Bartonella schoenbuchensis TaxID=165694 RepID=N6VAG5_9HYPH|nr:GPW/gp25 family protein [Bartonella schoenbuchensis]ENN90820.1 phage baseplate assembly protein GpW [Bartonella schoenbuchensis m07a]